MTIINSAAVQSAKATIPRGETKRALATIAPSATDIPRRVENRDSEAIACHLISKDLNLQSCMYSNTCPDTKTPRVVVAEPQPCKVLSLPRAKVRRLL